MSSFENPNVKPSLPSMSVTRASSASSAERRLESSSPAKPAPRITTCFTPATIRRVDAARAREWRGTPQRDAQPRIARLRASLRAMSFAERQKDLTADSRWDFSGLRALFVNCTLKPSPAVSNTQGLMDLSVAIMEANGVTVDQFRAVDHELAP